MTETSTFLGQGESFRSEAKDPGATLPPQPADDRRDTAAALTTRGRSRLPFIEGLDIRLAPQLLGNQQLG